MDDHELRYLAIEQILVVGAICSLSAGTASALQGLLVWPMLLALGAASLVAAAALQPYRRWSLHLGSMSSGASVAVWCGVLVMAGPGFEPILLVIALAGGCASGWASRFLRQALRGVAPPRERSRAVAPRPEDRFLAGVIEELPVTRPR